MKSTSSKIVFHLLVLMVCGASTVISKHSVTTCSCYRFYNQSKTWTEREGNCTRDGGHLVTMETEKEWTFINLEIQSRSTYLNEWRIGLKNESNEWKWVNNKNLTFDKWQPLQPSHDGKCVVMAKNYPNPSRGLWNDLPCNLSRGFICEYDKVLESDKCSYSGMFCLHPQITCATSNPDADPDGDQSVNLVYVVIALGILLAGGIGFYIYVFYCKDRNAGILLRCKKYRSCKFKTRKSLQMEEGRAPLQTEPTTEAEIENDRNKPDMENATGLENPVAKEATMEDSVNPDYASPDNPTSSTSTYAALYSNLDIEQKSPEENEDPAPPKMPSPCRKAPDEQAVYATIDKTKKTDEGKGSNVEVVYAAVDKKQKRRNTKSNS